MRPGVTCGRSWMRHRVAATASVTFRRSRSHSTSRKRSSTCTRCHRPLANFGLSSRSVLLMEDMRVKLSDVGVSRSPFEDNATMLGLGSGWWLAPEVITGRTSYSSACDIYEFGVILSELETHQMPFQDYRGPHGNVLSPATVLCMISVGQLRLNFSSLCPMELAQLANECLSLDPRDRPSAVEIAVRLRSFLRTIGADSEVQTPPSFPQGQGIVLCEGIDA
ncbi:hypothetical protein PINS_up021296 [Pythium insidiosum]|nr:hypothetical protein PINS_up021296 [Pythium insidiosum]